MNQTLVQIEENRDVPGPLVDIVVPEDLQLTLGSSSTPPYAFKLVDNQLFLNMTPDYEVQAVGWIEYAFVGTYMGIHSPNPGKIPGRRS